MWMFWIICSFFGLQSGRRAKKINEIVSAHQIIQITFLYKVTLWDYIHNGRLCFYILMCQLNFTFIFQFFASSCLIWGNPFLHHLFSNFVQILIHFWEFFQSNFIKNKKKEIKIRKTIPLLRNKNTN